MIGHNGAGKTTLLKVLGKIYAPTGGVISIEGKVESLIDTGFGLNMEETGKENIRFILKILGVKKDNLESEARGIERFTELDEFLDMPVRIYSAGMRTRLSFAISTHINPDILLMDEVIGAGDAAFKDKAARKIEEVTQKTKILVLATHSNSMIKKWCNKVIWLEKGQIMGMGDPEEMIARYHENLEFPEQVKTL